MTIKEQIACDQIRYRKPISIVNQFLDFVMNMRAQAPIRVTPVFPRGWSAEVAAEDKVWTIECSQDGDIRLTKVADLCGHTYNWQYIKRGEEDISGYERHLLKENYYEGDFEIGPITCDLFCNSDENMCLFCPYGKSRMRC